MKLTKLLKEVQEESDSYMSVDLEFETDAHGNLEIWSGDHEDLLAVVDRKTGHVDYRPSDTVFSDKEREAIEAAAERFLDDESDPSDPTAMYADRFPGYDDPSVQGMWSEESATATVSKKPQSPVQWFADRLEEDLESKGIPLPYKTFQKLLGEAKQMESEKATEDYNRGYEDGRDSEDVDLQVLRTIKGKHSGK